MHILECGLVRAAIGMVATGTKDLSTVTTIGIIMAGITTDPRTITTPISIGNTTTIIIVVDKEGIYGL
jgi:hypothetical protein